MKKLPLEYLMMAKLNKKGDVFILILTVVLAGFGVIMVYSASYYTAEVQYGDAFFFAKKQFLA